MPLDRIRSAYNFVPLSAHVVEPDWPDQAPHDVPYQDGVCGRFELEIQAHTPIFVRGRDGRFFTAPDPTTGELRPTLPGSTTRGLLRNVVEIASFGRMERVNNHRYGVRDLQNPSLYGRHMADLVVGQGSGQKKPMPFVNAGWLRPNPEEADEAHPAVLEPCAFSKIHYNDLMELAEKRGIRGFDPRQKQSAPDKYKAWTASRAIGVTTEILLRQNPPGRPRRIGAFGRVTGPGPTQGVLVFTGQPAGWNPGPDGWKSKKQHDFVFHDPQPAQRILVSRALFDDFCFVHADSGQQHRLELAPNPEWKFWKERAYDDGKPVPVFFLLDEHGGLRAMGLAMMFRLAYRHSVAECIGQTPRTRHEDREALDLAERIFGTVPLERGARTDGRHTGLRGRVSFGLGHLHGDAQELAPVRVVLGTPKASFYPNYIEQDARVPREPGQPPARGPDGKARYVTFMDDGARIRGWKRYPQREEPLIPLLPTNSQGRVVDNEQVMSVLRPLKLAAAARFRVPVRVHNLREVELGALLWALDLGGGGRHGLGTGKGLGFGSVSITIRPKSLALQHNRGHRVTEGELARYQQQFVDWMERQLRDRGGWRDSRPIFELQAMARPVTGRGEELRAMYLRHPVTRINEFIEAKRPDAGLALAPHGEIAWRTLHPLGSARPVRAPEPTAPSDRARRDAPGPSTAPSDLRTAVAATDEPVTLLRRAMLKGEQWKLLSAWAKEGENQREARVAAAREVLGGDLAKTKNVEKYPDVMRWVG